MKNLVLLGVLALASATSSCRTAATMGTPAELKAVPTSQAAALEVVIEQINANDPKWVDAQGNVLRSAILPILEADKAAWDQFDNFYND